DLDQSVAFFTALGFKFNPKFTDENATCMIVGEDSFVMLLVESFFATFTNKPLSDATKQTEVLVALSCETRDKVDTMIADAIAVGATTPMPSKDYGFMYQHGFQDLDGHLWEVFYMDADAMPA
ncbi:MAG: glyoxalase/bleomycin resistance/extradiol dioxygenase family protein, partial [Telluria sp.]